MFSLDWVLPDVIYTICGNCIEKCVGNWSTTAETNHCAGSWCGRPLLFQHKDLSCVLSFLKLSSLFTRPVK